jgi:Permuted papain-like amidase enzyme, YaeF/YiiX, C92 family
MNNIPIPVENLPTLYPWYKKVASNITYYLSQIPLLPRHNLLTRRDIREIREKIQDGDVILGGNFQHMSWVFIDGIVTHAMSYIGKGRCIHAFAHGVNYVSLRRVVRTYDTLIILRPYWQSQDQIRSFKKNIQTHIWKPYDFFFWLDAEYIESYFCTKLVNDALIASGYDTQLLSVRAERNIIDTVLDKTFRAHRILKPEEMIHGNFETILFSHNIRKIWEEYTLVGWKISQLLP